MSALAKIEIAAAPEVVRKVFLDFPNWPKIGDRVIRSLEPIPPNAPVTAGSMLAGDFDGFKSQLKVLENTPSTFSWRTNVYNIMTGNRIFNFLPSETTPGHTTFVNGEKFERLFWVLVATGVMKEQKAFEDFNAKFKARVEDVVAGK